MHISILSATFLGLCITAAQADYLYPRYGDQLTYPGHSRISYTLLTVSYSEEAGYGALYQRDAYGNEGYDLYARNAPEFYERDAFDFYERDVLNLYERDGYGLSERDNKFFARATDALYKRELNRLNTLFGRAPAPAKSPRSSRPSSPNSHHSSDSDWSAPSTDSARQVAMTKLKTSHDKKIRIVGVDGCTGIFIFGSGFITGAHAAPDDIPGTARRAAQEASQAGRVTSIRIIAPVKGDGSKAQEALRTALPGIPASTDTYAMMNKGFWEFEATPGGPVMAHWNAS